MTQDIRDNPSAGAAKIGTRSRLDVMRREAKNEWVQRNQTVAYYENELRKAQIARTHADNDVKYWDGVHTMEEVLQLCLVEGSFETVANGIDIERDGRAVRVCAEKHPCPVHGRPLADSDWRLHPTRASDTYGRREPTQPDAETQTFPSFGIPVETDATLSPRTAELRDMTDGRVVGTIVDFKEPESPEQAALRQIREQATALVLKAREDQEFGDSVVVVCDRATAVALIGGLGYDDRMGLTFMGCEVEVNPNVTGVVAYRRTRIMPSTLDADIKEKS